MSSSVFVRETGGKRSRRERGNYSGRNSVHLWPCVGKALHCARVCAFVSQYNRPVRFLSILTCIPFLSPSSIFFFLTQSFFSLNPSLPRSASGSWSYLSSSSSHSVHSALQISLPTHMHVQVRARTHIAKGKCF